MPPDAERVQIERLRLDPAYCRRIIKGMISRQAGAPAGRRRRAG